MAFTLTSYNILADAYLRRGWYPRVAAELLSRQRRRPALLARLAGLGSDVLCLQEVERGALSELTAHLRPLGYEAHHARKGAGKPDGVTTLVRQPLRVRAVERLAFGDAHDGQGPSGHVALFVTVEDEGRPVVIANSHVRWDPPGTPEGAGWAPRQLGELLGRLGELRGAAPGALPAEGVVCGDLNLKPDSPVLRLLVAAGLEDSHRALAERNTCHANGRAQTVDYLFHSPGLRAEARPLPLLHDGSSLPSETEPSDHLPVTARLRFAPP